MCQSGKAQETGGHSDQATEEGMLRETFIRVAG